MTKKHVWVKFETKNIVRSVLKIYPFNGISTHIQKKLEIFKRVLLIVIVRKNIFKIWIKVSLFTDK